ncbi:long-chain-fatty-acid--CoA ligase [Bacillus sp. JJ722]|uniref:long-chain-fatty-acid--CoA ligase n=1 Tax=Bacillus sp. JJ722 TaxID=3122973 RepID=UPI002FFFBBED
MNRPWHKFYPKQVPYEISPPTYRSVYEILHQSAQLYPTHIAIIENDKETSYSELKKATDRLASALYQSGFRKGDRIALMLPNCVEYVISYYAIQRLGGIVVQVNPMYQPMEVKHTLEDSEATWFISYQEQKKKLEQINYLDKVTAIFIDGKTKESSFYAWLQKGTSNAPSIEIDLEEDLSILQYTGGTTGKSKGVMITHHNVLWNLKQGISCHVGTYEQPGERVLGISPLFHGMGLTHMNQALSSGATLILIRRFEVSAVLNIIRKLRPTVFIGSPTMYIALLNYPDVNEDDLKGFKYCGSGSAPLSMKVMKDLEAKTGNPIIEGYGLSEATAFTHRNPSSGVRKLKSIGIPAPSTDCRIVDSETGEVDVPIGQPGEIIVKGPQVMKGYWKNEAETIATIRDGWLYTGDLAVMDEDGYFYIVGRKKDMIIAGGFNIYPKEIEEVLFQHPTIKEVCVYGIPDAYRGETVKAAVVLKDKTSVTIEELKDWCKERLTRYKVPTHFEFRSELPKTAVGKVLRTALIEQEKNHV